MTLDERLRGAAQGIADRVEAPYVDIAVVRAGARNRTRRMQAAVIAAVFLVTALTGAVIQATRDARPEPVVPPGLEGGGAVWYDGAGLHHGDVVEQTAVELYDEDLGGDLALVRTGALYRDPATNDVWFHPWVGEPRIVGRTSFEGPGGDANGDLAVWFEDFELVVYDTVQGREVLRTTQEDVVDWGGLEHIKGGNGFKQVSVDHVIWRSDAGMHRLDIATGESTLLWQAPFDEIGVQQVPGDPEDLERARTPEDLHDDVVVWGGPPGMVISVTGRSEMPIEQVEPIGRLSADGAFVLAPWERRDKRHGAAIVELATGEVWKLPQPRFYGWIGWSYADVALVLVDRDGGTEALLACRAAARQCEPLPYEGEVVLPTS